MKNTLIVGAFLLAMMASGCSGSQPVATAPQAQPTQPDDAARREADRNRDAERDKDRDRERDQNRDADHDRRVSCPDGQHLFTDRDGRTSCVNN